MRELPLLRLVALALALRLLSATLAFGAHVVFPLDQPEQFTVLARTHKLWDTFARYDSGWYWGIARDGYQHVEGGRSNLAFFPVYPLLMRAAGELAGGRPRHYIFGGIAVSWLAFTVAVVMLYRLAREDLDEAGAWRAVVLASVFPFAFFFGVVYSESTFLAAMVTAVFGFRTGRWWLGGAAGAVAVCTRVNGIVALPAFAWLAWRAAAARRDAGAPLLPLSWRDPLLAAAASLAVVAGAFAWWCAYVYTLSGSPLEWAASITRWNYRPGGAPWTPILALAQAVVTRPYEYLTLEHQAPYDLLNGSAALLAIVALPFVWRRFGAGYGLFLLCNLALPLSSGQLEGLGRYVSVLFPIPILLASIRSTHVHTAIVAAFAMLYMLCLSLFTTLHPLF